MATITPADRSYRPHARLAAVLAVLSHFLLHPHTWLSMARFAISIVLPSATLLILSQRYMTLERACALRLTLPESHFQRALRYRAILASTDVASYTLGAAAASFVVNFAELTAHARQPWTSPLLEAVISAASIVGLAVLLFSSTALCGLVCAEHGLKIVFRKGQEVDEEDVPLNVLSVPGGEWCELALTDRGQLVCVRAVELEREEEGKTFELKTTLFRRHPRYTPDQDGEPTGQVLQITM